MRTARLFSPCRPARRSISRRLDERGCALQTMRSWSTLQPGEYFACVGCHEHKNTAPPTEGHGFSLAMKAGPQEIEPFYGPPRGFSFPKGNPAYPRPHCIRCHRDRAPIQALASGAPFRGRSLGKLPRARASAPATQDELAFSLLGEVTVDPSAKRKWSDSYLILTQSTRDGGRSHWGPFWASAGDGWSIGLALNRPPNRCRPARRGRAQRLAHAPGKGT